MIDIQNFVFTKELAIKICGWSFRFVTTNYKQQMRIEFLCNSEIEFKNFTSALL